MATPHDHLDKLLETARAGQLDEFRRLVQETMCIDEIHPISHDSIVEMLAYEGYDDIVRYLVDHGAKIDLACHGTARRGNEALMNEFLDRGANKNFALDGAAIGRHTELMWSLIHTGADHDYAMMGAGENGDPTLIQALIENGANKFHALVGAIRSGNQERIRSLMSYSKSAVLIHVAALYGRLTLIDELKAHCTPGDFPELVPCKLAEGGYERPFLQRYGEQSVCLAWGICGAAMGGHVNFLNRLIEHAIQFALLDEKTALKWAVVGASQRNHTKLVDHLIERGATIEDALLGVNINQHVALADKLIAQGTASGQLRKNIAVRAAAVGKRFDLMNALLAQGASLDQALRGVCTRRENLELARHLIAQGASPEWIVIGNCEGHGTGTFYGELQSLFRLLPKPLPIQNYEVVLKVTAESGYFGWIQYHLERLQPDQQKARQTTLNAAVLGAARGGFRTMVTSLIDQGASKLSAIKGAVEVGDRDLIELLMSSIEDYEIPMFFKTAITTGQEDLVQWMLQRLGDEEGHFNFVYTLRTMSTEEAMQVQALSMIKNPRQQFEMAREAEVLHLIPAAKLVRQTKISPQIALALVEKNPASLLCLLNLIDRTARGMPREVKFQIFSQVAASEGFQIPKRDIPAFMRASIVAKKLADFNEVSPEEAVELAAIQNRLKRCQKLKPEAERKGTQVAKATTLYARSDKLSGHRNSFLKNPLLPGSARHMMQKFDKYQNLLILQKWLIACEERLSRKRQYSPLAIDMKNLREKLDQLTEFMEETTDPAVLARYLKTEFEGKSLYSILKPLKYWKDCVKHFPNMVRVLEESSHQLERVAEVRSSRGCGF